MIQRAARFSPNSVEKDRAILEAVAVRLCGRGHQVQTVGEEALAAVDGSGFQLVFSMGRLPETLSMLKTLAVRTVNRPEGVENCARSRLQAIMEQTGTPLPPGDGPDGYWLKRGDAAAQSAGDVVFAPDRQALSAAIAEMRRRGIEDYTVSAHVVGDLVKFYGVSGTGFFRCYYPTDDGQTKFGDEQRNGPAHHYPFDAAALHRCVETLALAVGTEVYGGDCIVRADGTYCVIDFNDWPSFSRCREEAADVIASLAGAGCTKTRNCSEHE